MKIGLTGGIGCGKSTVVKLFAQADWSTLQADAIVRDLLTRDAEVQNALRERWGSMVFRSNTTVDRKAVADRVFACKDDLNWLEALLHPKVRRVWKTALADAPDLNWLVEIPLLFEKKLETEFDLTICISCCPKVVEQRMISRGYSKDQIEQRRLHQMPLVEKINLSDYVISNSGSLEFLNQQVQRFIKTIN